MPTSRCASGGGAPRDPEAVRRRGWRPPPGRGGVLASPVATLSTTPATTSPSTLGGDRDGVLRDAVEEVHGAVDRVDDPADAGRARLRVVALLAQERVVGPGPSSRSRISRSAPGRPRSPRRRRWTWWRRPRRRRGAASPDQLGGPTGCRDGELEQLVVSVGAQRSVPRTAPGGRRAGWGSSPPGSGPTAAPGSRPPRGATSSPRSAAARSRAGRGPSRRTAGRRPASRPGRGSPSFSAVASASVSRS